MATATAKPRAERWLDEGGSFNSDPVAMATGTLIAGEEQDATSRAPAPRPTYCCTGCGLGLGVSGLGRHRVYFELGDERADEPVMNRVCPACGLGLPGKSQP